LLRLKDWTAAAQVLDEFRRSFPEHELQKEATKQIAYAYQQAGQLAQSAGEYQRVGGGVAESAAARRSVAAGGRPVCAG